MTWLNGRSVWSKRKKTEFNTALSIDFETAPQIPTERLSFQNWISPHCKDILFSPLQWIFSPIIMRYILASGLLDREQHRAASYFQDMRACRSGYTHNAHSSFGDMNRLHGPIFPLKKSTVDSKHLYTNDSFTDNNNTACEGIVNIGHGVFAFR